MKEPNQTWCEDAIAGGVIRVVYETKRIKFEYYNKRNYIQNERRYAPTTSYPR